MEGRSVTSELQRSGMGSGMDLDSYWGEGVKNSERVESAGAGEGLRFPRGLDSWGPGFH